MGFRGASWTRAAEPRTVIGSVRPVRRSPPFGLFVRRPSPRPKPAEGPPCAFAPLQRSSPRIRTATLRSGDLRLPSDQRRMLPLLDFDHPTAHAGVVDPFTDGGSLRHRVPRRGLATSFATFTTRPRGPRRLSAPHACRYVMRTGAPMGFTLQGFSLDRDRYSSRSPMPSCRYPARPLAPEGARVQRKAVFRAFIPRRVRADTGARRSSLHAPAADPFLGFGLSRARTHLNRSSL